MVNLSKRMEAIAAMITQGGILADVGTDHGYIPIYQVQQNKNKRAIAMDLREGPLQRANEHILACGLAEQIETRLSDGVEALEVGEADTIVVAGMGGELIIHILTEGDAVCHAVRELILQPQSEIGGVRRYLRQHGYQIVQEDMVYEDGKYYPMMRVISDVTEATPDGIFTELQMKLCRELQMDGAQVVELEDLYGPLLLRDSHPVLSDFLHWQETLLKGILSGLEKQPDSPKIQNRIGEISVQLNYNQMAQKAMTVIL